MKFSPALTLVVAFAATIAFNLPARAKESLEDTYQTGRRAYYQGDHVTAKAKLLIVLAEHPKHYASKALLKQINMKLSGDQGRDLRNQIANITLPEIDIDQLDLQSALDYLALVASKQSGGTFTPSFVVRGENTGQRLISLTLKKVPMNEVLRYFGEIADVHFHYEKYAVVATPLSTTPNGAAPDGKDPKTPIATAPVIPASAVGE